MQELLKVEDCFLELYACYEFVEVEWRVDVLTLAMVRNCMSTLDLLFWAHGFLQVSMSCFFYFMCLDMFGVGTKASVLSFVGLYITYYLAPQKRILIVFNGWTCFSLVLLTWFEPFIGLFFGGERVGWLELLHVLSWDCYVWFLAMLLFSLFYVYVIFVFNETIMLISFYFFCFILCGSKNDNC